MAAPALTALLGAHASASGWTPASLPNLVGWFDATVGVTVGTGASAWADQSGAGNNVAQATTSDQPATGSVTINGLNALGDWTSEDSLQMTSGCTIPIYGQNALTLFVALKTPSSFSNSPTIVTGDTNTHGVMMRIGTGGAVELVQPGSFLLFAGTATVATSTAAVVGFTMDGAATSTFQTFVNSGTAEASGSHSAISGTPAAFCIGRDNNYGGYSWVGGGATGGDIAEIVACSSVLGSTDLASLYTYLSGRWGTP